MTLCGNPQSQFWSWGDARQAVEPVDDAIIQWLKFEEHCKAVCELWEAGDSQGTLPWKQGCGRTTMMSSTLLSAAIAEAWISRLLNAGVRVMSRNTQLSSHRRELRRALMPGARERVKPVKVVSAQRHGGNLCAGLSGPESCAG